jgi:hypothetical protein
LWAAFLKEQIGGEVRRNNSQKEDKEVHPVVVKDLESD